MADSASVSANQDAGQVPDPLANHSDSQAPLNDNVQLSPASTVVEDAKDGTETLTNQQEATAGDNGSATLEQTLSADPAPSQDTNEPSTEVLPGDTSSIATVTTAAPASEQVQPLLDGSVNEAQPLAADSSAGDILEEGPPPSSVDPDNTPELAVKEPTTIDNLAEKVTDTVLIETTSEPIENLKFSEVPVEEKTEDIPSTEKPEKEDVDVDNNQPSLDQKEEPILTRRQDSVESPAINEEPVSKVDTEDNEVQSEETTIVSSEIQPTQTDTMEVSEQSAAEVEGEVAKSSETEISEEKEKPDSTENQTVNESELPSATSKQVRDGSESTKLPQDTTDGPSKAPLQNGLPSSEALEKSSKSVPIEPLLKSAPVPNTSNKTPPTPAKGSAVFQSSQPVGGKSLPPWMQTGKIAAAEVTGNNLAAVQMVGSNEDSAEDVQASQQEYKKQFSDRKKFFKQQMEEQGTVPIKVAPPPASYREKAPVVEPQPATPVVLSPVQAPPQFRLPAFNTPDPIDKSPISAPFPSAGLIKPEITVHPASHDILQPKTTGGLNVLGLSAGPQQPNSLPDALIPPTNAPTPFPSPESATPLSAGPMWSPPTQSGAISQSSYQNPINGFSAAPLFDARNLSRGPAQAASSLPAFAPAVTFQPDQAYGQSDMQSFAPAPQNQYQPSQQHETPTINGTGNHAPLPDLTDIIGIGPVTKKKNFADSSFYSDRNELFPTFEEQVKLCQDISSSLTSDDNKQSLGARMFTRRRQNAKKWVAKAGENGADGHEEWRSEDEGMDDPEEQKPTGPPPMKYYKSGRGVDDAQSLMQKDPEVRIFDAISPTSIAAVAQGLQNTTGRGADLFHKRKQKSEEWIVDESNVKKAPPPPVVELTHGNKLQQILNSQSVLYVQSPWEAAMNSPIGSCEKAFQKVGRGELANLPAQSLLSRTPSPMFGSNSPLPQLNQQASPHSASPAPPPTDGFSRLPRGWGASSPTTPMPRPVEPAVEVQQRFMQQPPSPSPKPVSPTFKPLTPDPVQNYKPFVPTPIYQPPQQQQPQMPIYQPPQQQQPQMPIHQPPQQQQPQMPIHQPPQQQQPQMPIYQPTQQQQPQFSPQPVQQQYVPPPVQTHFAPLPVYTPQPAASRALSVAPQEMVNTVYRAAPPNVDRLFNTANADLQRDAEVPNYQPAPQTLVRRYSQQFDNYNPQYSNQQPQSGFQPGYQQQPQSQNYQTFSGQQQNYYKQPQAQQSRHVSWNPELKQTQHYAPQSTNEFRRQYDERHKQWERPPEPMSSRIRPRSRSQPPVPYNGRQGYAPNMPSPSYGTYGATPPQHGSPTPKWGPNMNNWAPQSSPQVQYPIQQTSRPTSGSWGPDMNNWAQRSPLQQQTYRPAQQQQQQQQQQRNGTWGSDMNNWRPRYAPQQVNQTYRPAQQTPQNQGSWSPNMNNWGPSQPLQFSPQQSPRFPAPQQSWSSGGQQNYSSTPEGYATLPSSRSRQGQSHQQQTSQYPQQVSYSQPSYATLPRSQAAAWSVGRSGGVLVSDM